MESNISATEAARRFSDILNRVVYRGEEFVVERGGEPVCRIVPASRRGFTVGDLAALLEALPKPDPAYWDRVEDATRTQAKVPRPAW